MKKKVNVNKINDYLIAVLILLIIISGVLLYSKENDNSLQEFTNLIIKGSSNENATLEDGIRFAEKHSTSVITGNSIIGTIRNTASDVSGSITEFSGDRWGNIQDGVNYITSKAQFKTTTIQTASKNKKFKILIIGNDFSSRPQFISYCNSIKSYFNELYPYSSISNQFTIVCGTLPFNIGGVDENAASKALILTIAKLKKQELGYDYAFVLENGAGRSFALPTLASLVFTRRTSESTSTGVRTFMHELAHMNAGLADEYSNSEDIKEINNVIKKMGLNIRFKDQLDIFNYFGFIAPPNCIKKIGNSCGDWFEGCALVNTGVCRPTQNSIMRDITNKQFNQQSIDRIFAVAKGMKIN